MKAILEFQLPEDAHDYLDAKNGMDWHLVVENVDSRMRSIVKYEFNRSDDYRQAVSDMRELLREEMESRGLVLFD